MINQITRETHTSLQSTHMHNHALQLIRTTPSHLRILPWRIPVCSNPRSVGVRIHLEFEREGDFGVDFGGLPVGCLFEPLEPRLGMSWAEGDKGVGRKKWGKRQGRGEIPLIECKAHSANS